MSQKIAVSLDEALQLFLFLEGLNHFFHSPTKYTDPASVVAYVEGGMYEELRRFYYRIVPGWLPENVLEELENRQPPDDVLKRLRHRLEGNNDVQK